MEDEKKKGKEHREKNMRMSPWIMSTKIKKSIKGQEKEQSKALMGKKGDGKRSRKKNRQEK